MSDATQTDDSPRPIYIDAEVEIRVPLAGGEATFTGLSMSEASDRGFIEGYNKELVKGKGRGAKIRTASSRSG